jgi:PASTA domain-containing protein
MADSLGKRAFRSKEWMKSHPFVGGAMTGFLGLLIGLGAGSAEKADLEARLSAARAQARPASSSDASQGAESTSSQASLESERDQLQAQNARLRDQILRLNAKREMPDVVGMSDDYADRLSSKYGWNVHINLEYSTEKPGTILSQRPAPGSMMRYEALFTVVVAKAIPKVPGLVGLSQRAAVREAKSAGYSVVTVEQISTEKAGTVISISPGAGSRLVPGQTLTLTIAKKAPPAPEVEAPSDCDYDPCLPPASDYDCLGGSGDGPEYTGMVRVIGVDIYDLDADNDGVGCE